eukprot:TRINITY_DN204_c0_g1_i2.p2 TRINITY_DN204_c0_g1~~TRINITY_DN204_c0_g1_i2.p2  ORF type:complete len:130 (+),score=69.61 TRINITY_DN204_c0_g1_i2:363-752(+)
MEQAQAQSSGESTEPKFVQMTVHDYDKEQLVAYLKQMCIGAAITCFIHYKWGYPQPLLFQAVMNPMGLFDNPLAKIYLLGRTEETDAKLQRPFKAEQSNPLKAMLENPEQKEETGKAKKAKAKAAKKEN